MKNSAGRWLGWGLGDVDPKVTQIKQFLAKKFSYVRTALNGDETPVYNQVLADAVVQVQQRYGLVVPNPGVFDYATQVQSGFYKPAPAVKPLFFSVEGHSSDMWHGPVADTGTILEQEGRVRHQPIGYNNGALPFDNASGENELARLVGSTTLDSGVPFPAGTPWILGGFSQGGIVITDFYIDHLLPGGDLSWRTPDLRGVLAYGNPCRETGSVAPWSVAQAGPAANGGIDPLRRFGVGNYPHRPANWMDVYRKGDIFADNEPNTGAVPQAVQATAPFSLPVSTNPLAWITELGGVVSALGPGGKEGDVKSAVYQAVARTDFLSNPYSLLAQIANIFTVPTAEVIAIFEAIVSGIGFLAKQGDNPHYSPFNIDGGLAWCRSILP